MICNCFWLFVEYLGLHLSLLNRVLSFPLFSCPHSPSPLPQLIIIFTVIFSACLTRSCSQSAQKPSPYASSALTERWCCWRPRIFGLFGNLFFGCQISSSADLGMLLLFKVLQKHLNYGTPLNQVSILLTKNLPVTILVTFIVGGFPQIFLLYSYHVKFIFTLSTP